MDIEAFRSNPQVNKPAPLLKLHRSEEIIWEMQQAQLGIACRTYKVFRLPSRCSDG
jgi:hypothetical protein